MNLLGQYDAKGQHKLNEGIQVIFIPVVNVDGLAFLSKLFKERNRYYRIRKNRDFEGEPNMNRPESQGVDLNRNWDLEWNNRERD